jgi:DNA-binding FadR family transcriptional regulator
MKKRTRSILEELNNLGRSRNSDHLIESTANNIIESAINLLNRISNTYDENTAGELERRFLNAIKSGDPKKFRRGMQKVIESKQNDSIE